MCELWHETQGRRAHESLQSIGTEAEMTDMSHLRFVA